MKIPQKQIKERSSQYPKFVESNDEDQCFIGRCPTLFLVGVHGNDKADVYKLLCERVEEWVEMLLSDGTALHPA